jgi:hypothetical protein
VSTDAVSLPWRAAVFTITSWGKTELWRLFCLMACCLEVTKKKSEKTVVRRQYWYRVRFACQSALFQTAFHFHNGKHQPFNILIIFNGVLHCLWGNLNWKSTQSNASFRTIILWRIEKKKRVSLLYRAATTKYPCCGQALGDSEGASRIGLTRVQK